MSPTVAFLVALAVTLALLGVVVATGLRARRRVHLTFVLLAVLSLAGTIWLAERLGRTLDLESAGAITPIHLAIAKVATLAYLAPVVTGLMTIRAARWRRLHFRVAMAVLALTVVTAATGTLMVALADPLPPAAG